MALVEASSADGVCVLTLNRPERRNAVTPELLAELLAHLRAADSDESVTVILFTGAGTHFCAGGDFAVIERMVASEEIRAELARNHAAMAQCVLGLSKPSIAAVNGPALGFGAELAAFCDMVVMSETAYLCDPHIRFGLEPAPGALLVWPQLTSRAIAAELLLTGREVHAQEALRLGLANRVVPEGQALSAARELAAQLCALPREGVLGARKAIRQSYSALLAAHFASQNGIEAGQSPR
jgi:enoyl-CoA hydratase